MAAEGDGPGEVVVGVGPVVVIGPGVAAEGAGPGERYKKYALNHPRRTRYRIG